MEVDYVNEDNEKLFYFLVEILGGFWKKIVKKIIFKVDIKWNV